MTKLKNSKIQQFFFVFCWVSLNRLLYKLCCIRFLMANQKALSLTLNSIFLCSFIFFYQFIRIRSTFYFKLLNQSPFESSNITKYKIKILIIIIIYFRFGFCFGFYFEDSFFFILCNAKLINSLLNYSILRTINIFFASIYNIFLIFAIN